MKLRLLTLFAAGGLSLLTACSGNECRDFVKDICANDKYKNAEADVSAKLRREWQCNCVNASKGEVEFQVMACDQAMFSFDNYRPGQSDDHAESLAACSVAHAMFKTHGDTYVDNCLNAGLDRAGEDDRTECQKSLAECLKSCADKKGNDFVTCRTQCDIGNPCAGMCTVSLPGGGLVPGGGGGGGGATPNPGGGNPTPATPPAEAPRGGAS